MTSEKQKLNIVEIACAVFGFILITTIAREELGFTGIIPSALAGALGALFGYGVSIGILKIRSK